jgi:hypothetical protein
MNQSARDTDGCLKAWETSDRPTERPEPRRGACLPPGVG